MFKIISTKRLKELESNNRKLQRFELNVNKDCITTYALANALFYWNECPSPAAIPLPLNKQSISCQKEYIEKAEYIIRNLGD